MVKTSEFTLTTQEYLRFVQQGQRWHSSQYLGNYFASQTSFSERAKDMAVTTVWAEKKKDKRILAEWRKKVAISHIYETVRICRLRKCEDSYERWQWQMQGYGLKWHGKWLFFTVTEKGAIGRACGRRGRNLLQPWGAHWGGDQTLPRRRQFAFSGWMEVAVWIRNGLVNYSTEIAVEFLPCSQ